MRADELRDAEARIAGPGPFLGVMGRRDFMARWDAVSQELDEALVRMTPVGLPEGMWVFLGRLAAEFFMAGRHSVLGDAERDVHQRTGRPMSESWPEQDWPTERQLEDWAIHNDHAGDGAQIEDE